MFSQKRKQTGKELLSSNFLYDSGLQITKAFPPASRHLLLESYTEHKANGSHGHLFLLILYGTFIFLTRQYTVS